MKPSRALLLVAAYALAGCHDNGNHNGGSGPGAQLKTNIGLDLAHVVGFAVGGGGPAARREPGWLPEDADGGATTTTQHLYAIDDQGNLVITTIVTVGDADGGTSMTTMMNAVPVGIVDTPLYVVFEMDNLYLDTPADMGTQLPCFNVFMRKSDGALFCDFTVDGVSHGGGPGASGFDYDTSGNDVFVADATGLRRVDVTGATPQSTTIFDSNATGQVLEEFTANADADALVSFRTPTAGGANGVRVIKKNGGLQNLSATRSICQWRLTTGSQEDFYYIDGGGPLVQAAHQADGSYMTANLTTATIAPAACKVVLSTATSAWGTTIHSGGITDAGLVDMFAIDTVHPVAGVPKVLDAVASSTAIFVEGTDNVGNGVIARVDLPSMTATTILPPGAFSLTAISVSKGGDLAFAGLRNSDGSRVIGNVPAGSDTFTIVSASAPMVTALQRIN